MTTNKKIPWWVPRVTAEGYRLVQEVLDKGYLNDGEYTELFEKKVASLLDCKHVTAVTSGTAAMFLSLKALGVGIGDEVIVPDMTFIATANAVDLCGAKPVLVDVDPETMTIDLNSAAAAITDKTKAIIPVHVTGRGANMKGILDLARQHRLFIVEDAAEAFLSKYHGRFLGTLGNAGCFSLSPFKIIGTGQGGLIATNDEALHLRLTTLKDQGRPVKGTGGDDRHDTIGYNFKFTNLQAAVGLGQLSDLEFRMNRIRRTYRLYSDHLNPHTISLFKFDIEGGELPLWIDAWTPQRDVLDSFLRSKNIDCRRFWHPLHTQKAYWQPDDDRFIHSTRMAPQSIWLPSAFTLTDEDVLTVCQHVNSFFQRETNSNFQE